VLSQRLMLYYTHNTQILHRGGCSVLFLLMFTPCNFLDLCKLDLMIAVTTAQKKIFFAKPIIYIWKTIYSQVNRFLKQRKPNFANKTNVWFNKLWYIMCLNAYVKAEDLCYLQVTYTSLFPMEIYSLPRAWTCGIS
jgi:hypothetical protein